jgi:hypothetical protein
MPRFWCYTRIVSNHGQAKAGWGWKRRFTVGRFTVYAGGRWKRRFRGSVFRFREVQRHRGWEALPVNGSFPCLRGKVRMGAGLSGFAASAACPHPGPPPQAGEGDRQGDGLDPGHGGFDFPETRNRKPEPDVYFDQATTS